MLAQEAVVKPDAGHVEAGGASVVGVGLGDAPAVSDAVGLADTVDELLRVVDGVADGVPVALPVALPVDVTVPDWLGVLLLLSETEPVMEALAPAVSDAVGLADTVDELLRVVDGVVDGVPVALAVEEAVPVGEEEKVAAALHVGAAASPDCVQEEGQGHARQAALEEAPVAVE